MRTWWRTLTARTGGERGSVSLELVIVAPALLLVLAIAVFAGRVVTAGQTVEQAAAAAARTASIARTAGIAQVTGDAAARDSLAQEGLRCTSTSINVDTSGFARPVGTAATVTVTISCVVNTSDLAFPGVPGTRTVTGTAVSPIDTYRSRT